MKRLGRIVLLLLSAIAVHGAKAATSTHEPGTPSPTWTRDLVIYEIATKSFTSPKGPESGTFESLKARLPYLQDLGITAIWLTGHSLADPKHFYNIWTQYAVIAPDQLDPSLGTEAQFKALIDEAHRRGIKVFLDVINHGVMADSPLIKQHPQWFLGGSWGMVDYDWDGGHADLDDWWVALWSKAVTEWKVDGFRLDTNTPRPDLWARIKRNAAQAGHPIVIFEEFNRVIPGLTEFSQLENYVGNQFTGEPAATLANDIPAFYAAKFGRATQYSVEVVYEDNTRARGRMEQHGELAIESRGLTADKVRIDKVWPDGLPDVQLDVKGIDATRQIRNVIVISGLVSDYRAGTWVLNADSSIFAGRLAMEGDGETRQLYLPTQSYGSSILLSSHDNGWTDSAVVGKAFPLDRNPYTAQGSRALFGYSLLFTPMIPIFMAGEEFDSQLCALSNLSPDLFGGKNPGKGRWLYGAMLDWAQLEKPRHRGMLEDVKRMLAIRKQEWAVLAPETRGEVEPQLTAVSYTSTIDVPVPYMRWKEGTGIVILANRNTDRDAQVSIEIPLEKLGESTGGIYTVTDLWNGSAGRRYRAGDLSGLKVTVKRDKTVRGGIVVLKVERK